MRKCSICGAAFRPVKKHQVTCKTPECQAERQRQYCRARRRAQSNVDWSDRECPECGTVFTPQTPNKVFCTSRCRYRARNRKAAAHPFKRVCMVCGNSYETFTPEQRACSQKCRDRMKNKEKSGEGIDAAKAAENILDPLYGQGHRWCGVPVESTSFAPLR